MPHFTNKHGLAFTAASQEAVDAFDRTILNFLSFHVDTGSSLKAMLALDPDMPMAQCLRGYFFLVMGVGVLAGKAKQDANRLAERAADLLPRERMHGEALGAWASGSLAGATAAWQRIATAFPRDILAVKLAHFGHFYLGDPRAIRDAAAAVMDFWGADEDEQPYVQTMYAFGLEESGEAGRAEALAREALARQPNDAWGIHAVAHSLEATGRLAEGIAFLDEVSSHWQGVNNFRYHVAWHKALFRFEQGDFEGALADFDAAVFAPGAGEYLDICNDASMLMRLELAGADVGSRWDAVAAKAIARTEERLMPFADMHFLLALVSSSDPAHGERARQMLALMESHAATDAGNAAAYAAALPAARGIVALREGRHADAARELAGACPRLHAIGGSNAQRDLFASLAAEAAWRAGGAEPGTLALLAQRTHSHPHQRRNWTLYMSALESRGEAAALAAARRRMAQYA